MEADEILRGRTLLNRHFYQQKTLESAEALEELPQPTKYTGFDATTGMGKLQDVAGNIIFGNSITSGVIAFGDTVRMRGDKYDAMPTVRLLKPQPVKKTQTLSGFIVWNMGYTKNNAGIVDRSVDFFSGILDRDDPKWKKSVSYDNEMPNIKGLKLIYIPMPNRSLSNSEKNRLKSFQKAGGVVFVTGEHSLFQI